MKEKIWRTNFWFAKTKILTPRCDAHCGVKFFYLSDRISRRNRNWIQKYISLLIRGPDGFEFLWHTPFRGRFFLLFWLRTGIFRSIDDFFNVYKTDLICTGTVYLYLFSSTYFCALNILRPFFENIMWCGSLVDRAGVIWCAWCGCQRFESW